MAPNLESESNENDYQVERVRLMSTTGTTYFGQKALNLTKQEKLTLFRLLAKGPGMVGEDASEIEWSLFVCDSFLLMGV
jgi:hypothetical protein